MEIRTAVIGAGVIGLAIAARLSARHKDILVVEKNAKFGEEISSRNSEVIHAGIYYPKDSLKARFCVEGNRRVRRLCEERRIPHRLCGKLIVAAKEDDIGQLEDLARRGRANGVDGLSMISKAECRKMEPEVRAAAALWSPNTFIIDSRQLMRHFVAQAGAQGVTFVYQTTVTKVVPKAPEQYEIHVCYPDGERDYFTTRRVINAAGLEADRVAATMGIDIDQRRYRQHFWKGEYFSVQWPSGRLNHLVYPVPEPQGLGVHATIDLSGRIKLGPNAVYMPGREIDYTVDPKARDRFFEAARTYLPALTKEDLAPEMAGVRPKLQLPGDPVRDFIISEESAEGLPGIINLVGIESPGLTSCLAIAQYVEGLVR